MEEWPETQSTHALSRRSGWTLRICRDANKTGHMTLFDVLASIVLALHLWCIGLASSVPFFSLLVEWRESRGRVALGEFGRRIALTGIIALVAGMLVGLFYGWLLYDPAFGSALGRLKSRVIFGIIELVFSLCLFVLHFWWWNKRPQARMLERAARMFLLFLAATNLAYHSPTFFAVLSQLRAESHLSDQPLSSAEFRQMIVGSAILSQVVHFLLAALMIGAASILWLSRSTKLAPAPATQQSISRVATLTIGFASAAQLVIGTWVSINLPASSQDQFTNPTHPIAYTFLISLTASVALIPHAFWNLASASTENRSRALTVHVAVVILLMSLLARIT